MQGPNKARQALTPDLIPVKNLADSEAHVLHAASLDDRIILRNYGCSVAERFTGDREVTVSSSKSGSIAFSCLSLSEVYGISL